MAFAQEDTPWCFLKIVLSCRGCTILAKILLKWHSERLKEIIKMWQIHRNQPLIVIELWSNDMHRCFPTSLEPLLSKVSQKRIPCQCSVTNHSPHVSHIKISQTFNIHTDSLQFFHQKLYLMTIRLICSWKLRWYSIWTPKIFTELHGLEA